MAGGYFLFGFAKLRSQKALLINPHERYTIFTLNVSKRDNFSCHLKELRSQFCERSSLY